MDSLLLSSYFGNFYFIALSFISCVFFYKKILLNPHSLFSPNPIPPWTISVLNFFLILWGFFISLLIGKSICKFLLSEFPLLATEKLYNVLACGYVIQLSILSFIIILILFFKPLLGNLFPIFNFQNNFSLKHGFIHFLSSFIILVVSTTIWQSIIQYAAHKNWINPQSPQQLIKAYIANQYLGTSIIIILLSVIIAPIVEEFFFRGILYRFLKNYLSPFSSTLLSSFIFAYLHYNLLNFLPILIISILLTRTYENTQNLGASISFHAFFNFNTLLLLYLNPTYLPS